MDLTRGIVRVRGGAPSRSPLPQLVTRMSAAPCRKEDA